jgi:hypothetical protein
MKAALLATRYQARSRHENPRLGFALRNVLRQPSIRGLDNIDLSYPVQAESDSAPFLWARSGELFFFAGLTPCSLH